MINYKNIFLILAIVGSISNSNLARDDIEWANYEDFGMNNGKYEIGRKKINVYKKDGSLSGVIEQPMPNFDGIITEGNYSLWGDSQIVSGVKHVGYSTRNFNFTKRHLRKDVNLFKDYLKTYTKPKTGIDELNNKFSEYTKTMHDFNVGYDYRFGRLDKVVFDAPINEPINNWHKAKVGDIVARMGAGSNYIASDNGEIWVPDSYGRVTGGLNKIETKFSDLSPYRTGYVYRINLTKEAKTAIDAVAKGGDSGSPLFWWDNESNKWLIAGSNTGGDHSSWGKNNWYLSNAPLVKKYTETINDTKITDVDTVSFENNTLKINNVIRSFDASDIDVATNKTITLTLPNNFNDNFDNRILKLKNQIFSKNGLVINLIGDNDTSIARLEFEKNATIQGEGSLKTAGIVINKDATLTYKSKINDGNIVRKIGKGTLVIEGSSQNEGSLHLGAGETILKNNGGYAAKNIILAQGAKVKLDGDNQLNKNNIYFGLRGGILDLNAKSLTFEDIYHIDKGANISNSNETTKSTFTFNAKDSEERIYLGSFNGNLDVKFNPDVDDAKWNLRGNSDIKGNLTIEKGIVSLQGDNVIHGSSNDKANDEYNKSSFKAEKIDIKNSSTLKIGRATTVDSKIELANNSKLEIIALGKVLTQKDEKPDYESAPKEIEINKIVLKKDITFKNNVENALKNFNINLENNNEAEIEGKISGKTNIQKSGSGLVYLKNDNNAITGKIDVEGGKLKAKKYESLGNSNITIANNSIVEVEEFSNFKDLLSKLSTSSKGILSLGNNVDTLDEKYKDYSNLYLGSSKNIVIGNENTAISSNIKTLNLGGDGGTITLKGLDKDNTKRTINIGDGINSGVVIIDKITQENNITLNTKIGTELKVNSITSNKKFIDLVYGSSASYNLKNNITESSNGVLYLNEEDTNVENNTNLSIGTSKNKEITVSNFTTNDKYRLSGEGNTKLNFNLENKELEIDGQYFEGGSVEILNSNATYSNNVTIMGNKNGENKGNITLKINQNDSLGNNSKFLIKDGGILDLNSKNISLKIDGKNNEYGSIINSKDEKSTLTINTEENTILNNKISGKIKIIKVGSANLEFTNKNNHIVGNKEKGDIDINEGNLVYKVSEALNYNVNVKLNENTKLIVESNNVEANILTNGGNVEVNQPLDNKDVSFANIELLENTTITGYNNKTNTISYKNIKLDDKKVTFKDQKIKVGTFKNSNNKSGEFNLENSIYYIDSANNPLQKNNLSKVTLNNSKIALRDHLPTINDKNKDNLSIISIVGNSFIQNGGDGDNGGGKGANFVNPIELNEGSTLTLKTENNFNKDFNIDSKVSGNGKILLDATKTGTVVLKNNFKDFNGLLEVSENTTKEIKYEIDSDDELDRTISYNIKNGKFVNVKGKDLIFKNLTNFTGNLIARNGRIVLDGANAFTDNFGRITLENNNNLILKNNEETSIDATNMSIYGINNNVSNNETTYNIIKEGIGAIKLGKNTSNIRKANVKEGELIITSNLVDAENNKNIPENEKEKYDNEYVVSKNATLTLDIKTDDNILYADVVGEGNLKQIGKKITIYPNISLKNTGDLILESELDLKIINPYTLIPNLKGDENGKLTISSHFNNTPNLTLNKDFSEYKGSFNVERASLTFDIKNKEVSNKITGDSESKLINFNETELSLSNVDEFNGEVISQIGNILLKVNSKPNISKYSIKLGDIKIENNVDVDLIDKSFENNVDETKGLIKLGTGKLRLNSENIENIKNTTVEDGTLEIVNNKNENMTNALIKNNSILEVSDNPYIKNIENYGIINLENENLTIGNYKSSEDSIINISLNALNKNLLKIENSENDVTSKVILDETLLKTIKNKREKLIVSNLNTNLNILNLEEYSTLYRLKSSKDKENNVLIYSEISPTYLNILSTLNEINLLNMSPKYKFKNNLELNYINYNKLDKNDIVLGVAEYKNKLSSNGLELDFEYIKKLNNLDLLFGFNADFISHNLETKFKDNETVNNKFITNNILAKLGLKYRFLEFGLSFGNKNVFIDNKEENKKNYMNLLNHNLNIGINPEFKIKNDFSIKYLNSLGYSLNSLLYENISKSNNYVDKIENKTPINIYYETGIQFDYKFINFTTKGNFAYNFSNISLSNDKNNEKIENTFKDDWRIELSNIASIKAHKNILVNTEFNANIYQKSYSKYLFKLGLAYTW